MTENVFVARFAHTLNRLPAGTHIVGIFDASTRMEVREKLLTDKNPHDRTPVTAEEVLADYPQLQEFDEKAEDVLELVISIMGPSAFSVHGSENMTVHRWDPATREFVLEDENVRQFYHADDLDDSMSELVMGSMNHEDFSGSDQFRTRS